MKPGSLPLIGLAVLALLAAACSGPAATAARPPRIVRTSFRSTGVTIGVPASDYRVVVTPSGTCFVQSSDGDKVAFADVLAAGQTHTFAAVDGKLSVLLGSVQVEVSVQTDGRRVPAWRYTPTSAPFRLDFVPVG
jgi:hypothetical protein